MFDFNGDGKVDNKEMLTGMFIMDQMSKDGGGSGGVIMEITEAVDA